MSSATGIPKVQTVALVDQLGGDVTFKTDYPVPQLKPNEVLVKVLYTGVCQSDLHTKNGTASGPDGQAITKIKLPHIGGHEGVGTIIGMHPSIPTNDSHIRVDRFVGIRFLSRICRRCAYCLAGTEQYCLAATNHLHHEDGAFQEFIALDADNLTLLPDDVDPVTVGPTLCAGVTAYKAVKNADVKPGQSVVVLGAAGGLGHYAVQYAAASGARIIGVDAGATKGGFLKQIGVETYIDVANTTPSSVIKQVHELTTDEGLAAKDADVAKVTGAHAVIVTAGNHKAYDMAAELLRTGGVMACCGIPPPASDGSEARFPVAKVVIKGLKIIGNLVGSMAETLEAVGYVQRGQVKPVVEVREFGTLRSVYEEMEKGEIMGRVVVRIGAAKEQAPGGSKQATSRKRKGDDVERPKSKRNGHT